MSLRNKIVLIISVVAVVYVALDVVILRLMVTKPFVVLEEEAGRRDLARAEAAVEAVEQDLASRCRIWATGDDIWEFAAGANPEYVERRLGPVSLRDGEIHLLYVCDADLNVLWGRIEDPETREAIRLRSFPEILLPQHPIFVAKGDGAESSGLMATTRGSILVSSHSILDSRGEGPARGTLILGRFLDAGLMAELGERIQVSPHVWPIDDSVLADRERRLKDRITAAEDPVLEPIDDQWLSIYSTIDDILGRPWMLLRVDVPRAITASGLRTFNYALLSTLATALLILLVLLRLLQRIVIQPLSKLTHHAVEIGRTEDTSVKVGMDRSDEIGQLSREFDSMMDKLARSRSEVVETARLAGMSEIATGVLHNVGNVLNSVNVSANLLTRRAEELPVEDLESMTDVLTGHADDLGEFVSNDPRGREFLPFLSGLTDEMKSQRGGILRELDSLGSGVEHIMELVRSQQSYARRTGVLEYASIAAQVDAALSITGQAFGSSAHLDVTREYEDLPNVKVDKHRLMEILVNLIQNARHALEESNAAHKRLFLRVRGAGKDRIQVEIEDHGVGIPEESLTRIFNHGFTTREDGHGFGLHISANAAAEMKGTLHAFSDGIGKGARFVLTIPAKVKSLVTAA